MNIYTTQDEKQLTADYGKYLTLTATAVEDKDLPLCKIVHLPLTESTGDWQEIGEEEAQKIRQAKGHTAAAIDMTRYQQQMKLATMAVNTMSLTDEQALEVKELFPTFDEVLEKYEGKDLPQDFKFTEGGVLYKVLQTHKPQSIYRASEEGTKALYAVVSASATEQHAGTQEDPIPYVQNMVLEKGKYYTQDGVLYLCIQGTITGYPNDLKDLVSLVQKVEEESEL